MSGICCTHEIQDKCIYTSIVVQEFYIKTILVRIGVRLEDNIKKDLTVIEIVWTGFIGLRIGSSSKLM